LPPARSGPTASTEAALQPVEVDAEGRSATLLPSSTFSRNRAANDGVQLAFPPVTVEAFTVTVFVSVSSASGKTAVAPHAGVAPLTVTSFVTPPDEKQPWLFAMSMKFTSWVMGSKVMLLKVAVHLKCHVSPGSRMLLVFVSPLGVSSVIVPPFVVHSASSTEGPFSGI